MDFSVLQAMKKLVAPVERRVMLVVGRCLLTAIKDGGKIQTNQITIMAGETQDDVERLQEYGFTSVPLPGCEAVAVFVGGNREMATVIATDDRRYRLKGLSPGDVAIYNKFGTFVKLEALTGKVTVHTEGGDVAVETDGGSVAVDTGGGSVAVDTGGGDAEIDCGAGSSTVAAQEVTIDSGVVNVGTGADQKAVLGDLFKTTFDTHTHVGNLGFSTSPPSAPMPPTNLSTVVKVK